MKLKGTLLGAILAFVFALVFFIVTLVYVSSPNLFNNNAHFMNIDSNYDNHDWPLKVMQNLGQFTALKPTIKKNFQKEIYLVNNNLSLTDYLEQFKLHFKFKNLDYKHYLKKTMSYSTLIIYFEEDNGFLRIIEIKKQKKGTNSPTPIEISSNKPKKSVISIIIDDAGISKDTYENDFLNYPYPLTFAVLPFQNYSRTFANKVNRHNKEVIIHAPMQGQEKIQYNEITTESTDEDISELINKYKKEIPNAIGLNNHKGSLITSHNFIMKRFFHHFKHKGLFFVDSLTTPNSVAYTIAKELQIPALKRDIFLDNQNNLNYISSQIIKLVELGRINPGVIGIGHYTKPNMIKALKQMIPYFKKHNVQLVPLSTLIKKDKFYVSLRD